MKYDLRLKKLELYAWVGEDEYGSGAIGLKQGIVPAGCIPLASMSFTKVHSADVLAQGRKIVDQHGHAWYLVKFAFSAVVDAIEPVTS